MVAAHEAGHVLALAASGLAGEFQKSTIVPQGGVQGVTTRSGESLVRMSMKLAEHAQRLADPARLGETKKAFREFLEKELPKTCLRHLCYFFGGGSIDRFLGRDCPERNAVDMEAIRKMVLPAMAIQVSDKDLVEIQQKVDAFLWKALEANEGLFKKTYDTLVEKHTITNQDEALVREMCARARLLFPARIRNCSTGSRPGMSRRSNRRHGHDTVRNYAESY